MDCKECGLKNVEEKDMAMIPFFAVESEREYANRRDFRKNLAIIILIITFWVNNIAWLVYESQFEYLALETTYEQDGNGNNIIGNGNEVDFDGSKTNDKSSEEEEEKG